MLSAELRAEHETLMAENADILRRLNAAEATGDSPAIFALREELDAHRERLRLHKQAVEAQNLGATDV